MYISTITWIPYKNAVYEDGVSYLIQYKRQDWDAEDAKIGIFWHWTEQDNISNQGGWQNDEEAIAEEWIQSIAEVPDVHIY